MSELSIVFDNQLEQSPIEVPLEGPTQDQVGDEYNVIEQTTMVQTTAHGVCTPIFKIGTRVFSFNEVLQMTLSNDSILPSLTVTVSDTDKYLANLSNPKSDNEMRLQILPPFDNAYKKIDLTFKIDEINIQANRVRVSGRYKNLELDSDRLESFGEITTYDLFNKIAKDTKLGFASNITDSEDKRYIYVSNNSYLNLMSEEINMSGTINKVLDYWIDLWNNINLADIKERYDAIDPNDQLKVWILKGDPNQADNSHTLTPQYVEAILNNSTSTKNSQLYTDKYEILNSNSSKGTDKILSFYKNGDIIDTLIQDGNTHKDIVTKYIYLGENESEYEYLFNTRDSFLQFMNSSRIRIHLKFPLLGLMRGHKVRFAWYENDERAKNNIYEVKKSLGIDIASNDPELDNEDSDNLTDPDKMIINKQISGQYLITSTVLKFDIKTGWDYALTLVRPRQQQNSYLE